VSGQEEQSYSARFQKSAASLALTLTESHAAQHPLHTLQTEAHIATAQQQFNFNDIFLLIISTKTVILARFRRMLPDDGPSGPKHVEAI
jgi:hypothetical protein